MPASTTADSEVNTITSKRRHRLIERLHVIIRPLMPRTLRGVLILLLLVLIIPKSIAEVAHYYELYQSRGEHELEHNLEVSRAVATTFEAYINDILHQEFAIGLALSSTQPTSIEHVNEILALNSEQYPSVRNFSLLNPQGQIIASSETSAMGLDLGGSTFFREIAEGKEWAVSDLFRLRPESNEPVFTIARAVHSKEGVLQWVVTAVVSANLLGESLLVGRSGQASIGVVDSQGRLVYRFPEIELTWEARNVLEAQPFIAPSLAGEEVSGTFTTLPDGQRRMAAYTPISSFGWAAGAGRPEAGVVASINQSLAQEAGSTVLIIIITLLIALIISSYITFAVRRLREFAAAIGRGETRGRVKIDGPVELKDLALAFEKMGHDIRDREKQREDYVNRITHDLRTPLTIIQGHAQALQERLGESDVSLSELGRPDAIIAEARHMNVMIQDLVESVRLESGQLHLRTEQLDLHPFITDLVGRAKAMMGVERVRVEIPQDLPPVDADPDRLERIFMNLIGNALKHSPPETEVLLTAENMSSRVTLCVADRGTGIDPENLPYIFDRFYRGKITGKAEGLGLGLYITKMLVEAHGGCIWAKSEPGQGAKFFFTLPLVRSA